LLEEVGLSFSLSLLSFFAGDALLLLLPFFLLFALAAPSQDCDSEACLMASEVGVVLRLLEADEAFLLLPPFLLLPFALPACSKYVLCRLSHVTGDGIQVV
jgi:uncharacterized membrane protein